MTGILTFYWADDYGAMLQTYALKAYLEKQGEVVEIIPYAPLKLRGRYQLLAVQAVYRKGKWKCYRDLKSFCWRMCFIKHFLKRRKAMSQFRKQYLTEEKPIEKIQKLRMGSYDNVFVGSDQVWNSRITFGLDDAYMGNIKEKNQCRWIAYGASFGKDKPPMQEWRKLKKDLSENFFAVSLREKEAADFTGWLLGGPVADVLDPVLLLEKEAWEAVEQYPREKEYIFFYATEMQEFMSRFAEKLSRISGCPILQFSGPYKKKQERGAMHYMDVEPEAFIGYLHHATYVITNSFHGLAFSVLFEKQFLVFQHSTYHVRLKNLLEKFSLEKRLVESGKRIGLSRMEEKIDWLRVREHLKKERESSERFIKEGMKKI